MRRVLFQEPPNTRRWGSGQNDNNNRDPRRSGGCHCSRGRDGESICSICSIPTSICNTCSIYNTKPRGLDSPKAPCYYYCYYCDDYNYNFYYYYYYYYNYHYHYHYYSYYYYFYYYYYDSSRNTTILNK